MTTTLKVRQPFDGNQVGAQLNLPDAVARALQNAYPGRFQFISRTADGSSGTPIVVPSRPNEVVPVSGAPDPTLAVTYGYALDLTSTPATLYHWTSTAWAVVLQAGAGGGTSVPTLATLTLSTLAGTAGAVFAATISGQTAGSTLSATAADGSALTIANGTLSGTFGTAGQKQVALTETLAGATGSPKQTTLTLTIVAATPVLAALGLSSNAAVGGTPFSAAITGRTAGSTLAATSSDGTALTISGTTLSGTFTAAGTPAVTLIETLAGATGSPKSTQLAVTVSATAPTGGAFDFSDATNSGLAGL